MYVCIYICLRIYEFIQIAFKRSSDTKRSIQIYIHIQTYSYIYITIFTRSYIHIYICVYICIYIYIRVYIYIHIYIYTHMHTKYSRHTCILYMYICKMQRNTINCNTPAQFHKALIYSYMWMNMLVYIFTYMYICIRNIRAIHIYIYIYVHTENVTQHHEFHYTCTISRGCVECVMQCEEESQTLQHPKYTHCNTLQHTAKHCNTLQHTATATAIHLHNFTRLRSMGRVMRRRTDTATRWLYTLQHTAAHCNCSTLQHTCTNSIGCTQWVMWCKEESKTLQHTHCNTLQHTATHCNTLQHTATAIHCNTPCTNPIQQVALNGSCDAEKNPKLCNTHTATHRNTLQHTGTHCNTLQHTATHCNTPQLQHKATHLYKSIRLRSMGRAMRKRIPNSATHTLQHTATHCNTLQHTTTHRNCNTLQHTWKNPPGCAQWVVWCEEESQSPPSSSVL